MSKTIIEIETKTFVRFWLVIVGLGVAAGLIMQAWTGIMIVLAAAFFAIALQPLVRRLDRIDGKKSRRSLASVGAVVLVVVGVAVVLGLVGPMVVSETSEFLQEAPEQIGEMMRDVNLDAFGKSVGIADFSGQLQEAVRGFSASLISNFSSLALDSVNAVVSFVTAAVLVIVLTILFMLQGPELLERFWKMLAGRNKKASVAWRRTSERMAGVVAKYVSGQVLVALLDGTAVTVAVLLISMIFPGVEAGLAVPMGLLAVVMYMIPMFGPGITATVVAVLLVFNSLWAAVVFLAFYGIYEQIENNLISPRIQGKGMDLPPLLILVAIVIGMYAFGLVGTLVAIPVAGCIKVLVEEYPSLRAARER